MTTGAEARGILDYSRVQQAETDFETAPRPTRWAITKTGRKRSKPATSVRGHTRTTTAGATLSSQGTRTPRRYGRIHGT
ncbi:hypothetical protein NKH18_19415 [Streptomyces sp. M10(2022)]